MVLRDASASKNDHYNMNAQMHTLDKHTAAMDVISKSYHWYKNDFSQLS